MVVQNVYIVLFFNDQFTCHELKCSFQVSLLYGRAFKNYFNPVYYDDMVVAHHNVVLGLRHKLVSVQETNSMVDLTKRACAIASLLVGN